LIYGDHLEVETFHILIDGQEISYSIALNTDLYYLKGVENGYSLYHNLTNSEIGSSDHYLFSNAYNMSMISGSLYRENFEMFAFWELNFNPKENKKIDIDFIHFSGYGLGPCGYCKGNMFVFDTTNAIYWNNTVNIEAKLFRNDGVIYKELSTSLDIENRESHIFLSGTDHTKKINILVQGKGNSIDNTIIPDNIIIYFCIPSVLSFIIILIGFLVYRKYGRKIIENKSGKNRTRGLIK
jgi:hypothetical protein